MTQYKPKKRPRKMTERRRPKMAMQLAERLGVVIGHDGESNCIRLDLPKGELFPGGEDFLLCFDWDDVLEQLENIEVCSEPMEKGDTE